MGIHIIKMPDIGEGIAEVELVGWHVQVGDTVAEDQPLADVMTDRATVEIPSPVVGKVVALGGSVGDVMAVGSELIRLEIEGAGNARADDAPAAPARDDVPAQSQAPAAQPVTPPPAVHTSSKPAGIAGQLAQDIEAGSPSPQGAAMPAAGARAGAPTPARQQGERPLASPAVRKRAWDLGVELRFVHGSGPAGRILHEDLDAYLQGQGAVTRQATPGYRERRDEQQVPVVGLRRKIAQKMQE